MAKKITYKPLGLSHPGEILAEALEERNMTSKELAKRLNRSEKTISQILNGHSPITMEMALDLEKVLKIPADLWINLQNNYDKALKEIEKEYQAQAQRQWINLFPYSELAKRGLVPNTRKTSERFASLLAFFGVANIQAYENQYMNQTLNIAFKSIGTSSETTDKHHLSAWLRIGEIEAEKINTPPFNPRKLKELLPEFKKLMIKEASFEQIQQLGAKAGVKIVFIPSIPRTNVGGATRWFRNSPLIYISDLYKRFDMFWFNLFHEFGHILLHGKKNIFLEFKDEVSENKEEKEADEFAEKHILSHKDFNEIIQFINIQGYSDLLIKQLAEKYNTHPSIIVGRLQHYKIITYSTRQQLLKKINL